MMFRTQSKSKRVTTPNPAQTFFDHWEELRNRVIKTIIVFIIASLLFYPAVAPLLNFLIKPIGQVVFTVPTEAFVANVLLTCVGGFIFSFPYFLYHFWVFVAAGLKPSEKNSIYLFAPLSLVFFLLGLSFAYFIILPITLSFLLGFSTAQLVPMITVGGYVSFVGMLLLGFGLVFELPLVLGFLTKIGLLTSDLLRKQRRIAVLGIVIVSAFLTPPDVISQVLMSAPLLVLYEVGILFSQWSER